MHSQPSEQQILLSHVTELTITRPDDWHAHLRDGAAMVEFLAWLDAEAPKGGLTEIAVVEALEDTFRPDRLDDSSPSEQPEA